MDITFDQMKELVEIITQKDKFDYFISVANLIISGCVIALTYYVFFKTPNQTAKSKVYEKEIELLYKSFEYFCSFSDAVGLYVSNKYRKYNNLSDINNLPLEDNFAKNDDEASNNVYSLFKEHSIASSILQSIGALEPQKCIESYKDKTVALRKLIFEFEARCKADISSVQIDDYKAIAIKIEESRNELNVIKGCFFDHIKNSKETIKNQK
ncbi:hypothetical protein SOM41_01170 [Enterobacter sp. CFBP8995]|nr:hypothetical protein [Enterobacter sp. CFBP8995]